MKTNRIILIVAIVSLMLACNYASALGTPPTPIVVVVTQLVAVNTPVSQPVITEAPTLAAPTAQPTSAGTATSAPTPTSSLPVVTPLKDPVNCRFGPSVNFEQVYALNVGAFAQVTGKSANGGWWQVQTPTENIMNCWVADSVVVSSGDFGGIQTVAAPLAFITDVKFQVKPASTNLGPGCVGPSPTFSVKGTISVNGPLEVKWHLETKQDGSLPDHSLSFLKFGSQDLSYDYHPSFWKKGNYWVRLVITSPKNMVNETTYEIMCE